MEEEVRRTLTDAQIKDVADIVKIMLKTFNKEAENINFGQANLVFVGVFAAFLEANTDKDKDLEIARLLLNNFSANVLNYLGEMRGFK